MNPYTPQRPLMMDNMQDVSGQRPVFMNEAAQEQLHRALLQQNLGSPVGQQRSLGVNPVALAQMLRQGQQAPYGGTPPRRICSTRSIYARCYEPYDSTTADVNESRKCWHDAIYESNNAF